jgi:hypothetical protein
MRGDLDIGEHEGNVVGQRLGKMADRVESA